MYPRYESRICLFLLFGAAAAEVITLSKDNILTCVTTEDTVNLATFISPPTNLGLIHKRNEIDTFIYDDWKSTYSLNSSHGPVIDKRWEAFGIYDHSIGFSVQDYPVSFSVCHSGLLTLNVLEESFIREDTFNFTENIPVMMDAKPCQWFHYTLTKTNDGISLLSYNSKTSTIFKTEFVPFWVYLNTFWKLHEYHFKSSNSVTEDQESSLRITFRENLCLSMYVSVCKNCFLDLILDVNDKNNTEMVIGPSGTESIKTWQRIEIRADSPGTGKLSFFRGLRQEESPTDGYWAIDEITFCSQDMEVNQIELGQESSTDYTCEILKDINQLTSVNNQNVLTCNKPGYLGKNCNISCSSVLGESYPYCENYKICQDSSNCFCSWGYQGKFCDRRCPKRAWGLFCKNKCNSDCQDCHQSSGECLDEENRRLLDGTNGDTDVNKTEEILTVEDLPDTIILNSKNVIIEFSRLGKVYNNISYDLKYLCTSAWCENQVVEDDTIPSTSIRNKRSIIRQFENLEPFTDYQPIVTLNAQNQSIPKKYAKIKATPSGSLENKTLSVFSRNGSHLWIKFLPEHYVADLTQYRIWYHEKDQITQPKFLTTVSRCKLWENFICATIDNLETNTLYSIIVEVLEGNGNKWGLSQEISTVTEQKSPQAPKNIKIKWSSNYEAVLTWSHPLVTDGPLAEFNIEVERVDGKFNYSVPVGEPQEIYEYKLPVRYDSEHVISLQAINQFEGARSTIRATFLPTKPWTSMDLVQSCSTSVCSLQIPKPEGNSRNYDIMVLFGHNKEELIENYKILRNISKGSANGFLVTEVDDREENYLILELNEKLEETVSSYNNYSMYLVLTDTYSVYPVFEEQKEDSKYTVAVVATIITSIIIVVFLLLILLHLLHRQKLRNIQNNSHILQNNGGNKNPRESILLISGTPEGRYFTRIEKWNLGNYLKNILITGKDLADQYRSLPASTKPTVHAFRNQNKNKNKNLENIPYDHSRVILRTMDGLGTDDYINASYINGYDRPKAYIATQGPKFSTIRDFWRMIWQEKVHTIVMATNFMENKKRKCAEYFPQTVNSIFEYGEISIKLIIEEVYENYDNRIFEVNYKKDNIKVQHLHLKWNPDDMTPLYVDRVVPVVKRISDIRSQSKTPIVVHCSSGVNRTGTLILCDMALQMVTTENSVDFYNLIKVMRDQRPNMISSEKQYILAHLIVLECLMEEENVFKKSLKENFHPAALKSQLTYLDKLNKHDEIVLSWSSNSNSLDEYSLNPVLVDGYARPQKYLLSPHPYSTNTVHEFWDVIVKEKIDIVLSLNKNSTRLWPYSRQDTKTMIKVNELQSYTTEYCTLTKVLLLVIQSPTKNISFENTIYLFKTNECDQNLNLNNVRALIINIIDDVHGNCQTTAPILVTCRDGVTISGLFVALSYIIQKCQNELEVDICSAVRTVRRSNALLVNNRKQLEFLYRASLEYLQKFDSYSCVL